MNSYSSSAGYSPHLIAPDASKLLGSLVDAVNSNLISRAEAREWLKSTFPAFAKATAPTCKCSTCQGKP